MSDDPMEQGQQLREELDGERQVAGGHHRWRCSGELCARVVGYAVACAADGESHRRIAERLGLVQVTLSRWIREASRRAADFRPVAIVPARASRAAAAPPALLSSLRLVTPRGFVVEGLDPELLASLLRVLG